MVVLRYQSQQNGSSVRNAGSFLVNFMKTKGKIESVLTFLRNKQNVLALWCSVGSWPGSVPVAQESSQTILMEKG